MAIIKRKLWYVKIKTETKELKAIIFAYCEGRNFLWKMFLGWRETKIEEAYFWLPKKKLNELLEIYEYCVK